LATDDWQLIFSLTVHRQ